jgi:hypothetical protein
VVPKVLPLSKKAEGEEWAGEEDLLEVGETEGEVVPKVLPLSKKAEGKYRAAEEGLLEVGNDLLAAEV